MRRIRYVALLLLLANAKCMFVRRSSTLRPVLETPSHRRLRSSKSRATFQGRHLLLFEIAHLFLPRVTSVVLFFLFDLLALRDDLLATDR